jgi:hypothetical protein
MTGYTQLANHTYVAAYQADLLADLRNSRSPKGESFMVKKLAERWLNRTGALRATWGVTPANQAK